MPKKLKINPHDSKQADLIIERLSRPRRLTEEDFANIIAQVIAEEIDAELIKQLATTNNNTSLTVKNLNTSTIEQYFRNIL